MSKSFMFKVMLALSFIAAIVLWILDLAEVINWFGASAAIALVTGVWGAMFILRGLFMKTEATMLKKLSVYFGIGFLLITALMLINIFAIDNKYVLPIIALVIAVGLLVGIIATGGKSSDTGDNQKAGYKNYYQRKAEEEKKNKEED